MNRFHLTILAAIFLSACNWPKKPWLNDITSTKTSAHVNIPGTRFFIIPPTGLKPSKNFAGFENENGDAAIWVFDEFNTNGFGNNLARFKTQYDTSGKKIFERGSIKVNGYAGKYVCVQYSKDLKSLNILFGDTDFCATVFTCYGTNDTKTGEVLKNALATLYYDKDLKIDFSSSVTYKLDDNKSAFKFVEGNSSYSFYSLTDVPKDSDYTKDFIIITTVPSVDDSPKDLAESFLKTLRQKTSSLATETSRTTSDSSIAGLPAFEVESYCKINGKKGVICEFTLIGKTRSLNFQAIINTDIENNVAEVRKLVRTVQFK
ncbi:MAG: hypothetical protein JWO06_484 [Bacteroidota bacterium]|nr:hypothetical protein [Bacteroidota bacterium]